MQQRDLNQQQVNNPANASQVTMKRWTRHRCSVFTALYLVIGLMAGSMAIFSLLVGINGWPHAFGLWPLSFVKDVISYQWNPVIFLFFTVLAVVTEVFSYLRFPPPTWRVKDELTAALVDVGILNPYDVDSWKGMYRVAPIGKFNWNAKSFELLFDVATVKANDERLKMLQENLPIAGFHRAQEVAIEHHKTSKGNRVCFKLIIWYSSRPTSVEVF